MPQIQMAEFVRSSEALYRQRALRCDQDPVFIARKISTEQLIQRLKHQLGFTSIVVTHDMRFAERLADLVLFLHMGGARFFGSLKDFMASQDVDIQQFLTLDAYQLPTE